MTGGVKRRRYTDAYKEEDSGRQGQKVLQPQAKAGQGTPGLSTAL